jgi:hypothetical protein
VLAVRRMDTQLRDHHHHVAWMVDIVHEIAREQDLHFNLAVIHSELSPEVVRRHLRDGRSRALPPSAPLSDADIDAATHIVGMMGVEPIQQALTSGAQIVVAGRSSDTSIFAALPLLEEVSFDDKPTQIPKAMSWADERSAATMIQEIEFAPDSPLEGDGFEPSVPRKRDKLFVGCPHRAKQFAIRNKNRRFATGTMVRIHLPPTVSHQRTRTSAISPGLKAHFRVDSRTNAYRL